MTDSPIRTHADCVRTAHLTAPFTLVPTDWAPDTPLLVVAGLPEGATIRRLCDVPEGWEYQNQTGTWRAPDRSLTWAKGLVVCRPKPVPAPSATERVPCDHNAVGRRLAENGQEIWSTGEDRYGPRWFRILSLAGNRMFASFDADEDGMVEVLVEAPTGDDEPQADTPTPEGRWTVDGNELVWDGKHRLWGDGVGALPHADFPDWFQGKSWDALVELVRRDGTAPATDGHVDPNGEPNPSFIRPVGDLPGDTG